MPLQIVPLQLTLFAHQLDPRECAEFARRTGSQWRRSILAYLEFRAGEAWRDRTNQAHRNSPARWEYLDAIRLIYSLTSTRTGQHEIQVASAKKPPVSVPALPEPETRSRLKLVDELMLANPALTNRKLLLHLSKAKLARMLDEALLKARRSA